MQFREWLTETPIGQFDLMGNWGEKAPLKGWDKKSVKILTSEKGVEKIKQQWKKTNETFDMYLLRQPNAKNYLQHGEVTKEWVQENLNINIPFNENNISVIFTSNIGDNKIPMTGWILAHRFGHAISKTQEFGHFHYELHQFMAQLLKEIYNKKVKWRNIGIGYPETAFEDHELLRLLAQNLGTMKSAREGKIARIYEFTYDLISQYIITGKVVFQPKLARQIYKKGPWGRKEIQAITINDQEAIQDMEEYIRDVIAPNLQWYCEDMLGSFVGRIFVM